MGRTHCTRCGKPVVEEAPGGVAAELIATGGKGMVDFEVDRPGSVKRWKALQQELARDGFLRVVRDGAAIRTDEADYVDGPVEVVADRLAFEPSRRVRIAEAVETAYRFGHDRCTVRWTDGRVRRFSRRLHCPDCDLEYRRPEPRLFSPNSPLGACPECQGFGRSIQPDFDRILPDRGLTLAEGPVDPWNKPAYKGCYEDLKKSGERYGLRWDVPYADLPPEHRRLIEEGEENDDGFYGIRGFFDWLEGRTYKVHVRVFLARYRAYHVCDSCLGSKLRPEALAVRVQGVDLARQCRLPITQVLDWVSALKLGRKEREIAAPILSELNQRLEFLVNVGLGYLTLERAVANALGRRGPANPVGASRSARPWWTRCTCWTNRPSDCTRWTSND